MIDVSKLLAGDRRTLGKAITLIESSRDEDKVASQELLKKVLPHSGKSFRLGITGVPGVGKSTFIESFGQILTSKNFKVAVLAIDPSSPISGGSILGDKTRMEKLSQNDSVFIRPSPSRCFLGGVAQKTRETILLCEAAGYDFVIIETVGVGQSEFEVADMVDFFLVLMLPNAGDDLQGIKKGILELANAIIINKADGQNLDLAMLAKAHIESALHILSNRKIETSIEICSSTTGFNLDVIYNLIENFKSKYDSNNNTRFKQNIIWFDKLIYELIGLEINKQDKLKNKIEKQILENKVLPLDGAKVFVDELFK